MSSLRQHFEKVTAEKQAKAKAKKGLQLPSQTTQPPVDNLPPQANNKMEIKFFNDWEQLANIQSLEAKTAEKREILPNYLPWIEGTLASGVGTQNDMLLKLMVWCLDVHDFVTATKIAQFALLNNMVMPEPFSRTVACIYAEQMANEGLKNIDNIADYAEIYGQAVELTNSHDMPDEVRAKLYRAWGDSLKNTHTEDAILAYKRAISLDDKVGCKQDLKNLTKPENR